MAIAMGWRDPRTFRISGHGCQSPNPDHAHQTRIPLTRSKVRPPRMARIWQISPIFDIKHYA